MRFELLGPVRTYDDLRELREIRGVMPRTVLAVLLLNANAVVSTDELVDVVWGGKAPVTAPDSLQNHMMRLRRMLGEQGGARIRAVAPGYLIRVEPGEYDVQAFLDLCAVGAEAGRDLRWAEAAEKLSAALALWRGQPAADAPGVAGHEKVRTLLETRLVALEGRIDAELELGRHREAIGELRALAAEYPLREAFHRQLMLALYRADRQAEALDTFQQLRRALVDGIGLEPGEPVQQLHGRILRADPDLAAPVSVHAPAPGDAAIAEAPAFATATATAGATASEAGTGAGAGSASPGGPNVPHTPIRPGAGSRFQLPAPTPGFIGRAQELEELIELAATAPGGTEAGMVVISAIDGMGGIGKTALALNAANRVRERFPDGQLFLDLHGYATDLEPMPPADALDWFLRSLGVPPKLIPQDLGARAATYRDRLAGTRTLILLDNAAGAAQVRPLLPEAPGCLVLITSRKRLTGLDDAHSLALDVLPRADAIALLHRIAGPDRIPAHHPAIAELVDLCGHMPLAVRIVAARLRHHPDLRIDELVGQLRDENARLGRLTDENRDLTAVFDSSYADLPAPEQRLFRRLGLIPGPDFDAHAAANLAGLDHSTAEHLLESLLSHNMLIDHTPGRYRFHDLVRVYAGTLADGDPAAERAEALDRLLDYYQHTADSADRHLARLTRTGTGAASLGKLPTAAPDLPDRTTALTWMRTEQENLLAAIAHAAASDEPAPTRAVALTAALAAFLQQEGRWQQAATLHQAAISTAQRAGDRLGEATALQDLSRVRLVTGDNAATTNLLEQVLAIYQDLGDRLGEANAECELSRVRSMTGDFPAGFVLGEHALGLYRDLGDRLGEANTLQDLGRLHNVTGDFPKATALLRRAVQLYREVGHRHGEAGALWDLGRVLRLSGDLAGAGDLAELSLAAYRELDLRQGEANALWELSHVRQMTGDFAEAADLLELALAHYRELGDRPGEANALQDLGSVWQSTGDYQGATDVLERSLTIFRSLGAPHGVAGALQTLGLVRERTGDLDVAADLLGQSLTIFKELGARHGEANALQGLARVRRSAGDPPAAADLFDRSLKIFRDLGDPQGETEVLAETAALLVETGQPEPALELFRQALDLARSLNSQIDEARALDGTARCLAQTGDRAAALAALDQAVAIYRRSGAAEMTEATARLAALRAEES